MTNRALFLDRDGTLIPDSGYPHRPDDLVLLPGVVEALQRGRALGYLLVLVTNQSGVARGYFSEEDVEAFHALLQSVLRPHGAELDAIYVCPFHPTEGQGRYRVDSRLRKPHPGMLELAARELKIDLPQSVMIGDKVSDVQAGKAVECRTVLISADAHSASAPDWIAPSLLEAVLWIERQAPQWRNPTYARN